MMRNYRVYVILFLSFLLAPFVWNLQPLFAQIPPPVLVSPANNATTQERKPTFQWQSVSGATSYTLYIYKDAALTEVYSIDRDITTTTYTLALYGLTDGIFYWAVTATDSAGNESALSEVRVLTRFMQISPADGSTLNDTTPTFVWGEHPFPRFGYLLLVDNDLDYSSPEFICITGDLTCTPPTPFTPDTYFWKVGANQDRLGQPPPDPSSALPDSLTWSFTVLEQPPSSPSIISPASAFEVNTPELPISWTAVDNADNYEVQVDNNDNFGSPEFVDITMETRIVTAPLPVDGRYYIRVQAINSGGDSGWHGVTWGTLDTTPPSAPIPFEPANNKIIPYTRIPTLRWYASWGQNLYHLEVAQDIDFNNLVFPVVETTAHNYTVPPLSNGQYYWRVAERDPAGNWSDLSAISTFTISVP
jgi:hypothetical protein